MSLPELLLVLREDGRKEAGKALLALQTEALAAFAVWDKEAGRRLERFRAMLGEEMVGGRYENPNHIETVLQQWGVQSVSPDA